MSPDESVLTWCSLIGTELCVAAHALIHDRGGVLEQIFHVVGFGTNHQLFKQHVRGTAYVFEGLRQAVAQGVGGSACHTIAGLGGEFGNHVAVFAANALQDTLDAAEHFTHFAEEFGAFFRGHAKAGTRVWCGSVSGKRGQCAAQAQQPSQ